MQTTHGVPEELLQAVVDYFDPQRVILFGSRGDGGEDSDIDLLVVVDDEKEQILTGRLRDVRGIEETLLRPLRVIRLDGRSTGKG